MNNFRNTNRCHRHAFVYQKIGFPVQNVRTDFTHFGLFDLRNGTFLDRSDQQGDREGRTLR